MITKIHIYLIAKKIYELFCANLNVFDRQDFFLSNINDCGSHRLYLRHLQKVTGAKR